jgi:carbamoyltransferase
LDRRVSGRIRRLPVIAGVSGFKRNAAVAIGRAGELAAVCEQGRVVRARDVGVRTGGFPAAALDMAARAAGASVAHIDRRVIAEESLAAVCPDAERLDHHLAHASAAFLTSPFSEAAVLVCDTDASRELSVWRGAARSIAPVDLGWRGPGLAGLYSRVTSLLGFIAGRDEYKVEVLARLAPDAVVPELEALVRLADQGLSVDPAFDTRVADAARRAGKPATAGAFQRRLGELLAELISRVRAAAGTEALCLGGGLFFNTYLNTIVKQSRVFPRVFVPVNPGNAGVSAGCVLAASTGAPLDGRAAASPFLGPAFTREEIKAVLDNCKLSYDLADDGEIVRLTVDALQAGELVAWFRGRLEWGTRALGNRSIFANPLAPYVLENLNTFLKHRESHRAYGLVVPEPDAGRFFEGPDRSPYMEYEYGVRDPDLFAHACPPGISRLRVQTVDGAAGLLAGLLSAFGQATGTPVLINTSFNGFHEPIVCTPRDAVRVFYGSGLDVLVVGNFILRK